MRSLIAIAALSGVLALGAAACGDDSTSTPVTPAAAATTTATAAATQPGGTTPAAVPSAPASASASASAPGANPATRVTGTVASVAGGKVTLADGSSFTLAADARMTRTDPATVADLVPGKFVAITAKRQNDNTLLASIVMVFSDSFSKLVPAGQRPLTEGNLMTNATIDQVTGSSFTVTFTGGGAKVTLAPGATILKQSDITAADIKAGATVSASVLNGVAQSMSVM